MVEDIDNLTLINNILKIFHTNTVKFSKGSTITTFIENRCQMGIIINGNASLVRYDINGNKTILDEFVNNDIFGEFFHRINTNNEFNVTANEDTEVLFFNYFDLFDKNINKNSTYFETINILFLKVNSKLISYNNRIELLSRRSTRDKLITYFESIANERHNRIFYLDHSLSDLADYLCVDRSAMMREIRNLIDDEVIEKHNRRIKLIEH